MSSKENEAIINIIKFISAGILFIYIFYFPCPALSELEIIENAIVKEDARFSYTQNRKTTRTAQSIKLNIEEIGDLFIRKYDLYNCQKKAITSRIKSGDIVEVGIKEKRIFHLKHQDNVYTHLRKANIDRRNAQKWGISLSLIVLFLAFFIPKYNFKLWEQWLYSAIIITLVILCLYGLIGY